MVSLAYLCAVSLLLSSSTSVVMVSGEPVAGSGHSHRSKTSSSRSHGANGSPSGSNGASNGANGAKMNCTIALGKCTRRMPCGMALHDYRISCKQELYGISKNCSEVCQLSIISLANTPEGYDYLHCDCAKNEYCKLIRTRTQSCNPKRNNKEEIETCRGAELYCKADNICNTSYDYYKKYCSDLIKGKTKECNRRCNNTIAILWRNKSGGSLRNCSCEKNHPKCRRERESIMRYCFGNLDYRISSAAVSSVLDIMSVSLYPSILKPFTLMSLCYLSQWLTTLVLNHDRFS